jgi:hypothetical protein
MGNIVFNVALGQVKAYVALVGTGNAALIAVPLEATGLVADATMRDYTTLAAVLAGASNEQTTIGRKTITSASGTVNNTDDRYEADIANPVWTSPSGNTLGALLICYDPDTTGGDDTAIVPLTKHDWVVSADGSQLEATVTDFFRAASAA